MENRERGDDHVRLMPKAANREIITFANLRKSRYENIRIYYYPQR
jgi:hypothetical protein